MSQLQVSGAMTLAEFLAWVRDYDHIRGWDLVTPAQVVAHLVEELGEVGREVLRIEGYKGGDVAEAQRALGEELADLLMLAFKLAVVAEADLLGELQRKMAEIDANSPLDDARAETDRFIARQEERAQASRAAWEARVQELRRR